MEERLDKLTTVRVIFPETGTLSAENLKNSHAPQSIDIGESIAAVILVEYDPKKLSAAGESTESESDFETWLAVVKQLSVDACLKPRLKHRQNEEENGHSQSGRNFNSISCANVSSSLVDGSDTHSIYDLKLNDADCRLMNGTIWIIPITITLKSIPGSCEATLTITVSSKHTPETKEPRDEDLKKEIGEVDKTVSFSYEVHISPAPSLNIRLVQVAGRYNIICSVKNVSSKSILMTDCRILPRSKHWSTRLYPDVEIIEGTDIHEAVSIATSMRRLEILLQPFEEYTFMCSFRLQGTCRVDQATELWLAAHLTWHQMSDHKLQNKLLSTYLLPGMTIVKPPFLVSTSCCKSTGHNNSFSVTYNITNKLQDFLAIKLYWSPEKALTGSEEQGTHHEVKNLMNSVICHDPSVELGSCPKDSSMSVSVGFQMLKPGVFQLGTHMKLNLRYALGSHSNITSPCLLSPSLTNSDSNATISADDQLALESENLWRDRSASICSGHSADQEPAHLSDKRRSFATKSYSFGELGPTGSGDSTEDPSKIRFKKISRSSAVPHPVTPRPTPSSLPLTNPHNTMNPLNFMKKSCHVYVP